MKKQVILGLAVAAVLTLFASACSNATTAANAAVGYDPQAIKLSVTTVPLLVHEQTATFDWLDKAFKAGGALADHEVWGWSISTITAHEGDTLDLSFMNPSDDPHTFTVKELSVDIPIKSGGASRGQFVASKAGIYTFYCSIPEHYPYMQGQLVVLPDPA